MKYKLSFYKRTMAFAILLLLSNGVMTAMNKACIDLTTNNIVPLLHAIGPMKQVIKTGMTTTITQPGSYHILEHIIGNIEVAPNTENVVIDLNGFTVTAGEGDVGVIVLGENCKNIIIKNGSIDASFSNPGSWGSEPGITVEGGSEGIFIDNIKVINAIQGILFIGAQDKIIKCCKVTNCYVANCSDAFTLKYTNDSIFENCVNCCCAQYGFWLQSCQFNKIKKCKSIATGSTTEESIISAIGFKASAGRDNLFYECMAEGISKIWADPAVEAAGFVFDQAETESKIVNCLVDSVSITGTDAVGVARGIHLEMNLKDSISQNPIFSGSIDNISPVALTDVSWSPSGNMFAISTRNDDIGTPSEVLIFQKSNDNCYSWDVVKTIEGGNISHLEWDPTGCYLAMTGEIVAGLDEFKIYDIVNNTIMLTVGLGALSNPVWSRDGKYVIFIEDTANTSDNDLLHVYRLTAAGTFVQVANTPIDLGVSGITSNPAISPDEKVLSFAIDNTLYFYKWDFLPPFLLDGAGNPFATEISTISTIRDIAFSPTGCCGREIVVAVGDQDLTTDDKYSIEIFWFYGTPPVVIPDMPGIDFGANVLRVKFAPNGRYFGVLGTQGTLGIYELPASVVPGGATEVYKNPLGFDIGLYGGLDWSPSGRYMLFGGGGDPTDITKRNEYRVLEVADVVTNCLVCNNKVANVSGGTCAIGIEGASCCNGIMKNIVYKACVNYSRSVLDVWFDGLVNIDQNHINLAVPPYGVVPMIATVI